MNIYKICGWNARINSHLNLIIDVLGNWSFECVFVLAADVLYRWVVFAFLFQVDIQFIESYELNLHIVQFWNASRKRIYGSSSVDDLSCC